MSNEGTASTILRQSAEQSGGFDIDDETLVDIEQMAQALIYQDVAVRGPAWAKDAAEAKANLAQRLPGTGEWTIGNGAGSLKNMSYAEREEEENEKSAAYFDMMGDVIEKTQEREREREEWAIQTHSYAGVEMTGEEWGQFAAALQGNTDTRRRLIDQLKKDGKSPAQAEKEADQIALLAKMQSMPQSDWTPEMWAVHRQLEQDPDQRNKWNGYLQRSANGWQNSPELGVNQASRVADQDTSLDARTESFASGGGEAINLDVPTRARGDFPTAPQLTAEHGRAVAATEPLDAPRPMQIASTPIAPSPVVSPGGGFDV